MTVGSRSDHDSLIAALVDGVERGVDSIAERSIAQVLDEIPSYAGLEREELFLSVQRNLGLACETMRRGEVPRPEEIWQAERTTLERLHAGMPVVDVLSGFRVAMAAIQDRVVELADEMGVPDHDVVVLTRLLWRLGDIFSARGAAAYRGYDVRLAVADERRRREWLTGLLTGAIPPTQVAQGRASYDLPRDATYRALVTAPLDDTHLERVQTTIESGQSPAITAAHGGGLVGIVVDVPDDPGGGLVAVGPAVPPDRLADSFGTAQTVLAAARRGRTEGVHTLEGLGWRVGVPLDGEVDDLLRARYLQPLLDAGAFGHEVIRALEVYLDRERSIPATAAALHVHVNTLRYRLARFEELTGRSLTSTDTLVELAWALHIYEDRPS